MKKFFPAIFILLIVIVIAVPLFFTKVNAPSKKELLHSSSGYWVVNLADNRTLTHTSVPLDIGDQYISSDNKIYRITKIMKDKVYVEQIE